MLMTEIKRLKLPPLQTLNIPTLAEEALETLGYSVEEGRTTTNPLYDKLRDLGIEILDWRDVERYKLERRHEAELHVLEQELAQSSIPRYRTTVSWNTTEISKYKGHIPENVLLTAINIKKAIPGVYLFVQELTETSDPFLYVSMSKDGWNEDNRYYVEVWNEPKFQSTNTSAF